MLKQAKILEFFHMHFLSVEHIQIENKFYNFRECQNIFNSIKNK